MMSQWDIKIKIACEKRTDKILRAVIADCEKALEIMPDSKNYGRLKKEIWYCYDELRYREDRRRNKKRNSAS